MVKKLSILVIYLLLLPGPFAFAQQQNTVLIELKSQYDAVKPKEFYLNEIVDARKNKAVLGWLQPYRGGAATSAYSVNFKGGSAGLVNFMKNCADMNKKLRPIDININELSVSEQPAINGAVKGFIKINLSFALEGTYVPVELTNYVTTTTYQRPIGPAQHIEPILNRAIYNAIVFFDNWIGNQAGKNIKLAKGVKLSFDNYNKEAEGDTIYYSTSRRLKWDDFKARPLKGSNRGAEIFSYIGYDQFIDVKNGTIYLKIVLKSWLDKSASWVRSDMLSDYALNHEQRHFDITRLVAERFEARLKAVFLAPDTFEGEINTAYIDTLRELTNLQKQYDSETSHGIDVGAQEYWNSRIDKELTASGIKP